MKRSRMVPLIILCVLALSGAGAAVAIAQAGEQDPGTSPPQETEQTAEEPTLLAADVPEFLLPLLSAWQERGIQVLSLTADDTDPGNVTVKVPAESVRGPDSLTTEAELERRPALLRDSGLAVTWLNIVQVDKDGQESLYTAFRVDDLLPSPSWKEQPGLSEEAVRTALDAIASEEAGEASISDFSSSVQETQDGMEAAVTGIVEPGGSPAQGSFVDMVRMAVVALNRDQQAGIAFLTIDIRDPAGNLLVREFDDFVVANGGVRAAWVAPEYRKTGYQPDFCD